VYSEPTAQGRSQLSRPEKECPRRQGKLPRGRGTERTDLPMQQQPTLSPAEQDAMTDSAVLGLMLCEPSWPWSIDEIARELGDRVVAQDAVSRLVGGGLLHLSGDLTFPTRTARRAQELHGGV
jgi:hypothetical protein